MKIGTFDITSPAIVVASVANTPKRRKPPIKKIGELPVEVWEDILEQAYAQAPIEVEGAAVYDMVCPGNWTAYAERDVDGEFTAIAVVAPCTRRETDKWERATSIKIQEDRVCLFDAGHIGRVDWDPYEAKNFHALCDRLIQGRGYGTSLYGVAVRMSGVCHVDTLTIHAQLRGIKVVVE